MKNAHKLSPRKSAAKDLPAKDPRSVHKESIAFRRTCSTSLLCSSPNLSHRQSMIQRLVMRELIVLAIMCVRVQLHRAKMDRAATSHLHELRLHYECRSSGPVTFSYVSACVR
jgi:hypothetical protein